MATEHCRALAKLQRSENIKIHNKKHDNTAEYAPNSELLADLNVRANTSIHVHTWVITICNHAVIANTGAV